MTAIGLGCHVIKQPINETMRLRSVKMLRERTVAGRSGIRLRITARGLLRLRAPVLVGRLGDHPG